MMDNNKISKIMDKLRNIYNAKADDSPKINRITLDVNDDLIVRVPSTTTGKITFENHKGNTIACLYLEELLHSDE